MFDVKFCKCGTLLFVPQELVEKTIRSDKELLVICGHCGTARYIGAEHFEYDDENGEHHNEYHMYTRDAYEDFVIDDSTEQKPVIFWTEGVRVPMKSHEYARSYFSEQYADMWYPDAASYLGDMKLENFMPLFEKMENGTADESEKERFMRFIKWMLPHLESIKFWKENHCKVDMARLNRELTPDQKKSLMRYVAPEFDWAEIGEKRSWE